MKYSELQAGMRLVAGHGFDCLEQGAVVEVHAHRPNDFMVVCAHGTHFLDGQVDARGDLVGFTVHSESTELENSTGFSL